MHVETTSEPKLALAGGHELRSRCVSAFLKLALCRSASLMPSPAKRSVSDVALVLLENQVLFGQGQCKGGAREGGENYNGTGRGRKYSEDAQ